MTFQKQMDTICHHNSNQKVISILGSTGSIGTQTLDVIEANPELFKVGILTANRNWELLAEQARKFRPEIVVIADECYYPQLKNALSGYDICVQSGYNAICEASTSLSDDIIVGALVGYSGLIPTYNAVRQGKTIALANKETLVAGGEIITRCAKESDARIIPVDSEHSAIFQCLQGERHDEIRKLILTASGGPFRKVPASEMQEITPAEALKHPNWNMGAKVTIDSASMMNKGFEMIEARWLFDIQPDCISILVHPQSIVHSLVEFVDGSIKAQLGLPDMRIPIRYALGYPQRIATSGPFLNLVNKTLTFEAPDREKFPMLQLAFNVIATGGTAPALLNAANEIAVREFLAGNIRFTDMPLLAQTVLETIPSTPVMALNDIIEAHKIGTETAIKNIYKFKF